MCSEILKIHSDSVHKVNTKGDAKNMNSDQAKGKMKEAAGVITDDDKLKNEGKADQMVGDAKDAIHNVADNIEEGIDNIKGKIHKD